MELRDNVKGVDSSTPFFANNHTFDQKCTIQRYEYIPLDYVNLQLINYNSDELMNNQNLKFSPFYENANLKYYYAKFKNVSFYIYESGSIKIKGSLHKYYNQGIHNYNDFSKSAFLVVLNELNSLFNINPCQLKIVGLEYGINIEPPIKSDEIISNLIMHKKVEFENTINNTSGNYKQARHFDYILKIYNKSKQYKLNDEVIRIEIKQNNWREYRNLGIITLQDFMDYDKRIFINNLILKWNDVLFYNPINFKRDDIKKWHQYSNVQYWRNLKENSSNTTFAKHYKRLKDINSNSCIDIQKNVEIKILDKIFQLE